MKRLVPSTSAIALALSLALSACGGSSANGVKGPGEVASQPEKVHQGGLLGYLPPEGQIVFGGKYQPFLEYWKNSALKAPVAALMGKYGGESNDMGGMMDCWLSTGGISETAATFTIGENSGVIRMAFSGFEKAAFKTCGEKGGYTVSISEDGKYLEMQGLPDGRGGTTNAGYYFINDTTVYYAQKMPLDTSNSFAPSTRADLEADLKWSLETSAATDPAIQALVAKADQSKAMWFAGSAAGTPAAEKIVGGHGWIDADATSLHIGFSIESVDTQMPAQAVQGFEQAKGQVSMLDMMAPGATAVANEFLADMTLSADGAWLKGEFKLTNSVINKALPILQPMLSL